ncbi:TPA: hypothetical protein ACGO8M_000660 [Streptococcus suis]
MFVFAFPGMGKTTLAQQSSQIVDLEMSDIKYDNSSVQHLNKEERKSTPRPIKDKNYKKIYVDKAYALHEEGKTVLLAMNFLLRMLLAMLVRGAVPFHIYIPHPSLKEEYRQRYIQRGNNSKFIFEVMTIWYITLVPLYLLSKILPNLMTVTGSGQVLADFEILQNFTIFAKNKQVTQTIS